MRLSRLLFVVLLAMSLVQSSVYPLQSSRVPATYHLNKPITNKRLVHEQKKKRFWQKKVSPKVLALAALILLGGSGFYLKARAPKKPEPDKPLGPRVLPDSSSDELSEGEIVRRQEDEGRRRAQAQKTLEDDLARVRAARMAAFHAQTSEVADPAEPAEPAFEYQVDPRGVAELSGDDFNWVSKNWEQFDDAQREAYFDRMTTIQQMSVLDKWTTLRRLGIVTHTTAPLSEGEYGALITNWSKLSDDDKRAVSKRLSFEQAHQLEEIRKGAKQAQLFEDLSMDPFHFNRVSDSLEQSFQADTPQEQADILKGMAWNFSGEYLVHDTLVDFIATWRGKVRDDVELVRAYEALPKQFYHTLSSLPAPTTLGELRAFVETGHMGYDQLKNKQLVIRDLAQETGDFNVFLGQAMAGTTTDFDKDVIRSIALYEFERAYQQRNTGVSDVISRLTTLYGLNPETDFLDVGGHERVERMYRDALGIGFEALRRMTQADYLSSSYSSSDDDSSSDDEPIPPAFVGGSGALGGELTSEEMERRRRARWGA